MNINVSGAIRMTCQAVLGIRWWVGVGEVIVVGGDGWKGSICIDRTTIRAGTGGSHTIEYIHVQEL